MLKTLRDNFKHTKWILWAVIAVLVIFVFVDWGMGTTRPGGGDWAARAGDRVITVAEFQREYQQTSDRFRQMYGRPLTPELEKAMNLSQRVLDQILERQILREEASRLGLRVTDDEVTQQILSMPGQDGKPVFVKDGAFVGDGPYRRMLAGAGMTPTQFETGVREDLLLGKVRRVLTDGVFVSDEEIRSEFEGRNVKAKIAFAVAPVVPVAPASVSDAEADAWFKAHAESYLQPERRKATYLLVETAKVTAGMKVADDEIAAEYNANMDSYRQGESVQARHILYKSDGSPEQDAAAKAKADAAVKKLKGGADFAALAKAESDDPGSKANGGSLGSFPRGQMVKPFEDAAFGANAGDLVGPVKTPFGWHVLRVEGKTPERVQPLFEVSAAIRARLAEKKGQDEARRLAREIATKLGAGAKPSDDELRRLTGPNVTINTTDFVAKGDAAPGIGPNPQFSQALFTLKTGELSDPITTMRGEALVKLAEVKPAGPATLADVKAKVVADVVKKKQDDATVAAAKAAIEGGATLEAAAAKLGARIETPETFGKGGPIPGLGAAATVLDAVFAAPVNQVSGPVFVPERGAVIFRVVEKTGVDEAQFAAQKDGLRDQIRQQKAARLVGGLLAKKKTETKLEVNREVLGRFQGS